ncbi:SPI-1 type III secretion system effector SipA [Salmonella enterica]|uniref:SPI-1 type III secretion system effector SipA n=1 Tax=Salmonella enterica subsp. salamae TaxID=59202 RepID=A0A702LD20_SALER|nr:type III secretion system effector SipA [Salmonella enterica subsp. enterica]EAZ4760727.1 SPI-1 type III secretion system effector SipA [Salmonella enterica]ECJ3937823.1 type III secretion system effector SipA [Salmonella enterica subsp. salamae]EKR2073661.1 SPI-1 type III secretion system effector SipA [Salmonella enterica subsp. salamae serovar 9,46:l,w:e,n,x]EAW2504333.1 SPI-1 type III secretion system effector SipA [Salmonella enterica subsp. enterica]
MVTSVGNPTPVIISNLQTENRASATKLGANISAVSETSATLLSDTVKSMQLEDFPGLLRQSSMEKLFNCNKNSQALKDIFSNSENDGAKRAIVRFAELFNTAAEAFNGSPVATEMLNKLGEEYTDKILKDKLQAKSTFGPWTPDTGKGKETLKAMEKKLLSIVNDNSGNDPGFLISTFINKQVMPYISNCIESYFNCELDPSTRNDLTHLVDKAAMKAVEALKECHIKLTEEQGACIGKESRHIETAAMLPLLLRNIFTQIPKDKLPDAKIPEPEAGPVPDGGKKPEPAGINININIDSSNRSVDNSQHINNSRSHVDNSQHNIDNSTNDNSRKTTDNSRTFIDNSQQHYESHYTSTSSTVSNSHSHVDSNTHQTEMTHSKGTIDQGVAGKIDVTAHATAEVTSNTSSESTGGKIVTPEKGITGKTVVFDQVDGGGDKIIIGKPVQATVHDVDVNKEQSLTAEIVNVKPLASQLAGVENVKNNTLQSETAVITGNKAGTTDNDNSQTDKAGPFSGLKFKQNGFLSVMPSVTNMHSMHFDAREVFLGVVRKALEPDTSTPFPVRRAFDGLRAEILPNDSIKSAALKAQCSDINSHPELKAKMDTLKEVITHHPQREKLAEVAKQFAREAGLTRLKAETDYVLSNVLDGLIEDGSWRKGPAFESYLNKPGVDQVVTTVDGLHMQR